MISSKQLTDGQGTLAMGFTRAFSVLYYTKYSNGQ